MFNFEDFSGMAMMGILVVAPFVFLGAVPSSVLVCLLVLFGVSMMLGRGN